MLSVCMFVYFAHKGYIYIPPLAGKPEQQWFTIWSGVLTSTRSRQHSELAAAHCPNERTLDPAVCSYNRPTYAPVSRTMAFTPQYSPAVTHYFCGIYYHVLIATHLPNLEGWKAELAW